MSKDEHDYDGIMAEVNKLMTELENSESVKELAETERGARLDAAYQFLEIGCNYCCAEPAELNDLDIVKELMLEWVPRKVGGDDDYWRVFPDGVIIALRFLGGKFGWQNTYQLINWVNDNRKRFIAETNNPRNFGPAKAMMTMMQRDGVDMTDKKAVDRWIADYNRGREMSMMGLGETDEPPEGPIRNLEPKTSRNAPCPCGSGKKYKKCCGANAHAGPMPPIRPPVPVIPMDAANPFLTQADLPDGQAGLPLFGAPPVQDPTRIITTQPFSASPQAAKLTDKNYNVPLEEWRMLYDLAIQLRNLTPWDWMFEDELFGVQNPANKEIGYVSIMGNLGDFLSLAIYPNSAGLVSWQNMRQSAEKYQGQANLTLEMAQYYLLQQCLIVSFEDRAVLDKTDLEIIKKLGLKFRGSQAWPQFRSHAPGDTPWYLTMEEAEYLRLALSQVLDVARRVKKDGPEILSSGDPSQYLVRVATLSGDSLIWSDQWLTPQPIIESSVRAALDENKLNRLKAAKPLKHGIWELDCFFLPGGGISERKDERPYFSYVFLCVDRTSGLVIGTDLARYQTSQPRFAEMLINCMANSPALPLEICVKRDEVRRWVMPLAQRLDIKLTLSRKLPVLSKLVKSLANARIF